MVPHRVMPKLAVMKLAGGDSRRFDLRVVMKLVTAPVMVTIRVRALSLLHEKVTAEMTMA